MSVIRRGPMVSKRERREKSTSTGTTSESAATSSATSSLRQEDLRRKQKQQHRAARKWCGQPNLEWRAVPAEHLRAHPCFSPLPRAHAVRTLSSWRDLSNFEQSSNQWNMLHVGRLTTSRMSAAMGLLEPGAATALGVPRGLQGSSRARAAFLHLREVPEWPMETLEDAASLLIDTSSFANEADYLALMQRDLECLDANRKRLWKAYQRRIFGGKGRREGLASFGLSPGSDDGGGGSAMTVQLFSGCGHDDDDDDDDDGGKHTYAAEKLRFLRRTLLQEKKVKNQKGVGNVDGREMHRGLPAMRFAAEYNGIVSNSSTAREGDGQREGDNSNRRRLHKSSNRTRMAWGNVHEATAVLVALNHFHQIARDALVLECGMFPSEGLVEPGRSVNSWEHTQLKLLLRCREAGLRLGASPDGILVHRGEKREDASETLVVEALEVKNHSPFVSSRNSKGSARSIVRDRPPPEEVPPWYVPQLQLEMMMIGPHCRSAVFVRLTATQGASVMRLPRDDTYIALMLARALIFHRRFVLTDTPPHANFGFGAEEEAREKEEGFHCEIRDVLADDTIDFSVRAVAERTRAVAATASVVRRVHHREVQRARPSHVPLLL